ncbi:MAG: M1 family aminopeptidase [Pseudomonadota bacterium]
MFASIAAFEFRYHARSPVFWVVSVVFFLLTFGATTSPNIQIGGGGNVHANSPSAIIEITIILSIFFMFVTTAFVANVIVRDDQSGFGPMVRSTRVSKFDYLFGRFVGAFGVCVLAFCFVPVAIWLGSLMPWIDAETLGPNRLRDYLFALLVFAVPNLLLTAALFFAVATATRSMMGSYIGVVVFLVVYLIFSSLTEFNPDWLLIGAYFEAFGGGAYDFLTRYWTASERNNDIPSLGGVLLANRAFCVALALLALAYAYRRFSFAERSASPRQLRKQEKLKAKLARQAPSLVAVLPDSAPRSAWWARFMAQTRLEMRQVFLSPAFFVLILVGLFNSLGSLFLASEIYGTPSYPMTFRVIELLQGTFTIIPFIIAIFYGGELVWRDRDRKMHELVDATSIPNWAFMVPKTIAVAGVLLSALLISVFGAILVQLVQGYTEFEFSKYVLWYVLPLTVEMLTLAILSVFVQALSPSKYIGWGIMLLYFICTITFSALDLNHPLYLYGAGIGVPLSDMNGTDVSGAGAWWVRLYWAAVAVCLAVFAHLLWRRGTGVSFASLFRQAPRRLAGGAGLVLAVGVIGATATGAYVFNNTNVLNEYVTNDEAEENIAEYEKKYLRYESLKQPAYTRFVLTLDVYPETRQFRAEGEADFINDTGAPLDSLHVRFFDPNVIVDSIDVEGGELTTFDEEFKYRIYTLSPPMAPNETRSLRFESRREQNGFRAQGNDTRLVHNGTFLNNAEFAPLLGMDRNGLLGDRTTRRKYDLPAELRVAPLEDASATDNNYVGADWVTADITVRTSADQTPIAPGRRVSDEVVDGRRVARFVSDAPILAFFSVQSARYAVKERNADGVNMAVYYHPQHEFNVETMLDATERSLAYYKANFGPYPFDYARIVEFPGYARFAQAFAGTVPYSEGIGFIADNRDPDEIDYVTYVTAHEFGHQYWAHQLISANQQGGTLLVETLAQYSALVVMKSIYGEEQIRRFLKYELDRYLSGRGSEALEELPLNRVENQGYIHYRKGAVVMYLLQDRLGEARVNAMLADLLERYRFKGPPYPSSTELVDGFKALARTEAERELVVDLLEKITLYDLKAASATVRELDNGQFETTLTVDAAKVYADGEGQETLATLNDEIDVGVFTARPGLGVFEADDVLLFERRRVTDGEQTLVMVTSERPVFAGVDPYNKYIDRNADDNLVRIE